MSEFNHLEPSFLISILLFGLFVLAMNSDSFIQNLFFKSELDFNTLVKQPNRKKCLEKKELFFYALTPEERRNAINTMINFIESQKPVQKEAAYFQYNKSIIKRFQSPTAFYFAQCELNCFEESGFIDQKPMDTTQYSLLIPKDFEPELFME